jgi:methylmalonyl-CoA mutase cobalamin-binding subunit
LVYLAAVAEQEGMDVQIIDAVAENLSVEQTVVEIKEYKPDIVGISSTTGRYRCLREVDGMLKSVR